MTFPYRRDGPPEKRKRVSLKRSVPRERLIVKAKARSVHKGAIPKTPRKELSIRENLFVSLVFAVVQMSAQCDNHPHPPCQPSVRFLLQANSSFHYPIQTTVRQRPRELGGQIPSALVRSMQRVLVPWNVLFCRLRACRKERGVEVSSSRKLRTALSAPAC